MSKPPVEDSDDRDLAVGPAKTWAVGAPAVAHALQISQRQMGARRTALTLLRVNQKDGFDCPGCAWPEGPERSHFEFCENGAKAVAEEATVRRVTPEFFAEHSVHELAGKTDYWLGQQGRLTEPMYKPAGEDHYRPVGWDEAFRIAAGELRAGAPDEAVFYTSGRTSNEAAFLYQLLVRRHGTNNLPDCSNMCHESSGSALTETLGVGKGSVSLEDLYQADLILVAGQNPGTNHPRMLSALERAKKAGAAIVAVNPAAGGRADPLQEPAEGRRRARRGHLVVGRVPADTGERRPGVVPGAEPAADRGRGRGSGNGARPGVHRGAHARFRAVRGGRAQDVVGRRARGHRADAGTDRGGGRAGTAVRADHRVLGDGPDAAQNSVPTIREVVNFLLLRGNVGRPGAGVCPVRGHSNVQGDRTMGIYEKPAAAFLDRLAGEFAFEPPRRPGYDVVEAIRAMRDGKVRVFMALGGNFVAATPDTRGDRGRAARLPAHGPGLDEAQPLARGDRRGGADPAVPRPHREGRAGRRRTVRHRRGLDVDGARLRGRLRPAAEQLRSEVAIVAGLAGELFGPRDAVDWASLAADYDRIRTHRARDPGLRRLRRAGAPPDGFQLPHGPRDSRPSRPRPARRTSRSTARGAARAGGAAAADRRVAPTSTTPPSTVSTTVTAGSSRAGASCSSTRATSSGSAWPAARWSIWSPSRRTGGTASRLPGRGCPTAPGCAAAYFPETNVLVPLDSTAETSNTPT